MSEKLPEIPGYEILAPLGGGGMGDVYLARQINLERAVAIKLMKPRPGTNHRRFEREALLMAVGQHPCIVTIHDRGTIGDRPYLVMEYVEGRSLRQLLDPGKPMPVEEARRILRALTEGLTALHDRGILHRDLKPENVLLDTKGAVKICDFGIAVVDDELVSLAPGEYAIGTIDYMSREQRYRLPMDARADQYSVAVMAYEMLTGQRPVGCTYLRPSQLNDDLGDDVDAVLLRALGESPRQRYPTLREFFDALDLALSTGPQTKPAARRRQPLVIGGLTLMLVAVAVAVLLQRHSPTAQPGPQEPDRGPAIERGATPTMEGPGANFSGTDDRAAARVAPSLLAVPFDTARAKKHQSDWAAHLGVPVSAVEFAGMVLILTPPGTFQMGSTPARVEELIVQLGAEGAADAVELLRSEAPPREVTIAAPFYIGATEVTVAQFRAFVESTGYRTTAEERGRGYGFVGGQWVGGEGFAWNTMGDFPLADDLPVVNISQPDALQFCAWLSEAEDASYRLPSEAEWEWACRAGTESDWSFGPRSSWADQYLWHVGNSSNVMHAVADKRPNPFGLFDMHGNVFEWCAGSGTSDDAARRGGAFTSSRLHCRSASRRGSPSPTTRHTGFRVARDVAAAGNAGNRGAPDSVRGPEVSREAGHAGLRADDR